MQKTRRFQLVLIQPEALAILLIIHSVSVYANSSGGKRNSPQPPGHSNKISKTPGTKPNSNREAASSSVPRGNPGVVAKDRRVTLLKQDLARQNALIAAQQEQIEKLRAAVEQQKQRLDRAEWSMASPAPEDLTVEQLASLSPMIPRGALVNLKFSVANVPAAYGDPDVAAVAPQQIESYTTKVDSSSKSVEDTVSNLTGFRFSGDFRLRADGDYRSGNSVAGTIQNSRGRYRMRLYVDKSLNDRFDFHLGIGSGRSDNGLTSDSDFTGFATRSPLYIAEASAGYHPSENFSMRGGKLPEVFTDDSRFLFKEEIRFNGFQEIARHSFQSNFPGISSIEFRAGQYVLTNPNVPVLPLAKACTAAKPQVITSLPATIASPATLPANCAYLLAGYAPGSNVRDANLFHQGFVIAGNLKPGWHHQLSADLQLWRNQNQIALAATAAGFGVVLNSSAGSTLAGPITGTGTATTTPGGAIFTAAHFQIVHVHYGIGFDNVKIRDHATPITFDLHASRNVGAGFLRDAAMGIASFGEARKAGDIRVLYAYSIKDGNSMISEVTDDYLGSLSGVNIKTHEIRIDLGLAKFLAWQNYLYIINPRRPSDPALHFIVPVPTGANTQYRVQSQLQFKF